MFFESLEPRQLMSIDPQDSTIVWDGNTLPTQHALFPTNDSLLSAPTTGDQKAIGLSYLTQNAAALDLEAGDFQYSTITDQYTSNGITHIYLQQTFNGLRITDSAASVHIAPNGQIISANSSFLPDLPHPTFNTTPSPGFSARVALSLFAQQVGLDAMAEITVISESNSQDRATVLLAPELSDEPIKARLQYVPDGQGGVILGWNFNFLTTDRRHWWDGTLSADLMNSGKIVHLADWIDDASYNVFARPVEDPLDGNRSIVVDPHDANLASVEGWHDANGVSGPEFLDTRGNRVFAQHDRNGDDQDEGGTRPTSPTLDFDTPLDITQHPFTYTDATTTNVFYWGNLALDVAYDHGFDEVSGNFQQANFITGQGRNNDVVLADTQDPFATNNAFFGTPPDGINGFTAYGLVTVSFATGAPLNPPRDIGLDGTVVAHEFMHGISNRLTGGPANANALDALQSGGMGEGWGDWFGLVLTAEATDPPGMPRPIGEWATDTVGTGIRRYPYSFDMSVDPLTLGTYNGGFPSNEVHNAGEIWASALWDMTQLLVQKHGFDEDLFGGSGGLNVALDIVLLGMKLQPANPTFMQARDAILAADLALNRGDNFDEIWEAFARRGFGFSAKSEVAPNLGPNSEFVVEAFDRPTPLARIAGNVFQDLNGNNRRDASDAPLQGWVVYVDANNNAQLDAGEK